MLRTHFVALRGEANVQRGGAREVERHALELNGRLGRVTRYVADKARYGILLKYGQTWSKQSISLKKSTFIADDH